MAALLAGLTGSATPKTAAAFPSMAANSAVRPRRAKLYFCLAQVTDFNAFSGHQTVSADENALSGHLATDPVPGDRLKVFNPEAFAAFC